MMGGRWSKFSKLPKFVFGDKIEGQTFDHLMGVIKWRITVLTCLQGDLYKQIGKQIGVMLVLEVQIR